MSPFPRPHALSPRPVLWALALVLLTVLPGCAASVRMRDGLPRFTHPSGPKEVVEVAAPDGTPLHTRVFLPGGEGPWPVVLIRVPYPIHPILSVRCRLLTRYGYACLHQDVRGQGRSGGTWEPFRHERPDGLATLDWIDAQPWSSGSVAMHGESYLGAVQWVLAPNPHPTLKTIVPLVFGTDLPGSAYEHGLLRHDLITAWAALMPTRGLKVFAGPRYRRSLRHRPRRTMDLVFAGQPVPWFRQWLDGDDPTAPIWSDPLAVAARRAPSVTPLPVLTIGGWADAFLGPQLRTWSDLATQDRSAMVVGPWSHIGGRATARPLPGLRQAPGARGRISQWPRVLDWLDHHLKGEPLAFDLGVTTYAPGDDRWRHRDAWPPHTTPLHLFPHPTGEAGTCEAHLGRRRGAGTVSWTYDPADPTPSVGGAGLLAGILPGFSPVRPGFRAQPRRQCAHRDDLVGFVSTALPAPLHLAGPIRAQLRVSADVDATAVMVRLLRETPSGRRVLVREAVAALDTLDPDASAGRWSEVTLETWPVELVVPQGQRLVVELGSASFPRVEAHPNVEGPWADATTTQPATLTADLSATRITLPVWTPEAPAP